MHSRFFALPKKIVEIHGCRCYNYFGYLYADSALTYIRIIRSMKARNEHEMQASDKLIIEFYNGISVAVWLRY